MSEEEYYQQPRVEEEQFESPIRDMPDVFDKIITPRSKDKDTTRDIKLTKTSYEDRLFLMRLKTFIQICNDKKLNKAVKFYRSMHHHFANVLASDGGFTAKNIVTSRRMIEQDKKKSGGFFR